MDKELHEKALTDGVDAWFENFRATKPFENKMHSAIAAYLKTAGLKVVPVEPTEEMYRARFPGGMSHGVRSMERDAYQEMLAAFPSPFDEPAQ